MSHCGGRLAETSTTEGEKREKPSVWMKEGESLAEGEGDVSFFTFETGRLYDEMFWSSAELYFGFRPVMIRTQVRGALN